MRDDQDANPKPIANSIERVQDRSPSLRVESGSWLVSEQDTRRGGKRTSQSHPLPLATGQLRRKLRSLVCNAKPLKQFNHT